MPRLAFIAALLLLVVAPACAQQDRPQACGVGVSGECENVGKRTLMSREVRRADGKTATIISGTPQHYVDGNTFVPIKPRFRTVGSEFVADEALHKVRLHSGGYALGRRGETECINFVVPQPVLRQVENEGGFTFDGIDWIVRFGATSVELLTEPIAAARGNRVYEIRYTTGGPCGTLSVDAAGDVVDANGIFRLSQAQMIGATGVSKACTMSLRSQGQNRFLRMTCDDTGVALPYVIDPTTYFKTGVCCTTDQGTDCSATVCTADAGCSGEGSGRTTCAGIGSDDGTLISNSVGTYPPTSCVFASTTGTTIGPQRAFSAGVYSTNPGVVMFDTAGLPDTDTVSAATLKLYVTAKGDADDRAFTGEWFACSSIDCADWTNTASSTAFSADITGLTTGAVNSFALTTPTNVSLTADTCFRLHISGGEPTGINGVTIAAYENTTLVGPELEVVHDSGMTPTSTPTITNTPTVTHTPTATPLDAADCVGCNNLPALTPTPTQTSATPSNTPTPTRTPFFNIVLAGQSNMVGFNAPPATPDATSTRLWSFGNDYIWHQSAIESIDCSTTGQASCTADQVDLVSRDNGGFGPGQSAGMQMLTHVAASTSVGLIPCARAGSYLEWWLPGPVPHHTNTLYGSCYQRMIQAQGRGDVGCIAFFQGESDSYALDTASTWGARFTDLAEAWRADLGYEVPVVWVRIGNLDPLETCADPAPTPCPNPHDFPYYKLVQEQQEDLSLPSGAVVDTSDLSITNGDNYAHFSIADERTIGGRIADACAVAAAFPTATPTGTPTSTDTPTITSTPTVTFTPTITNTPTETPPCFESENTPTPGITPSPTPAGMLWGQDIPPTRTPTQTTVPGTPTGTPTLTPTRTNTGTPTNTQPPIVGGGMLKFPAESWVTDGRLCRPPKESEIPIGGPITFRAACSRATGVISDCEQLPADYVNGTGFAFGLYGVSDAPTDTAGDTFTARITCACGGPITALQSVSRTLSVDLATVDRRERFYRETAVTNCAGSCVVGATMCWTLQVARTDQPATTLLEFMTARYAP